jgi:hypothetical protein
VKHSDQKTARLCEARSTVVSTPDAMQRAGADVQPIRVAWLVDDQKQTRAFTNTITLGRDASCDIRLSDEAVSRAHVKIYPEAGQWHIVDLDSANGTLLDRVPIRQAILPRQSTLQLGSAGPTLWIEAPGAEVGASVEEIAEHYFGDRSDHEVGHRTMVVRRAYRRIEKTQQRRYRGMIAGAVGLLVLSIGIGIYQYIMLQKSRQMAMDIFYNMKAVQVQENFAPWKLSMTNSSMSLAYWGPS